MHRLEYWSMKGAGHTWAGANPALDFFLGKTDQSISATTETLNFFDAAGSPT